MLRVDFGKDIKQYEELIEEREKIMSDEPINRDKLHDIITKIDKFKADHKSLHGDYINCQTCVVAYYLQTKGINAYPKPNTVKTYDHEDGVFSLLKTDTPEGWNTGLFYIRNDQPLNMWKYQLSIDMHDTIGTIMALNKRIKENELYEVDLCFGENHAHAMIGGRNEKGFYLYDPQIDAFHQDDMVEFLADVSTQESWNYAICMRIDDTEPNWDIVSKCVDIKK